MGSLPLRASVIAVLLLGSAATAQGELPPSPWELQAVPATVAEGGSLTLTLRPRSQAALAAHDLYVSSVRDGGRSWNYLDATGRWSSRPTPYRRWQGEAPVTPIAIVFHGVNPSGWYTFRVQSVRPAAPPFRKHYVFTPAVLRVRVRHAPDGGHVAARLPVTVLALATAAAISLVSLAGRTGASPDDAPGARRR